MRSLLIVEDEKMIRMGIEVMVKRSPVAIEQVLSCKNGEEALEIVKTREIDVMFTDIRMPKMDGITLVKRMQACKHIPLTVVISGYDDFSYAVEMLRSGVYDYILKPVEREKIYDILLRLEDELTSRSSRLERDGAVKEQALRYLMMENTIPRKDKDVLLFQYEADFIPGSYYALCVNEGAKTGSLPENLLVIPDGNNQLVLFVPVSQIEETQKMLVNCYVGISGEQNRLADIHTAYHQAFHARRICFLQSESPVYYPDLSGAGRDVIPDAQLKQVVQLLGVSRWEDAQKILYQILRRTANGDYGLGVLEEFMNSLLGSVKKAYQNLIPMGEELEQFCNIWSFDCAYTFLEAFTKWMQGFAERLGQEFEDYQNKQKIQQAVLYINDHFQDNLNMATVSNHVSMNYSLFSLLFKQYTGTNFVSYLQDIRLDESKRLLRETDWRVHEVSHRTGFRDEKHFMKLFKSKTGVSPTEYRKNSYLAAGEE